MQINFTDSRRVNQIGLRVLVITLLVLGIFFRFINLERKVYWYDETVSALRVSGSTWAELNDYILPDRVISFEELQKFQHPRPKTSLIDTLKSLATDEPQHPPLYYVSARFWMQWLNNPVAVTRGWSAVISLLAFPCIYWLCRELFDEPLTGWMAIGLIAVSPFHVLYAQEARQYSLWVVTTLFSSASLLYAMRLKTKGSWIVYAIAIALGLYSHLLFAFVAAGHGIYVLITERFRLSRALISYTVAFIAGFVLFVPWLVMVLINLNRVQKFTAWIGQKWSLGTMLKNWAINLSAVFFDLQIGYKDLIYDVQFGAKDLFIYISLLIFILIGYSIYFLCRKAPKHAWLFILLLIGATTLPLALPDLISGGGRRAGTARFMIPCFLGIELIVAYLLTVKITSNTEKIWRKLWQLVAIALVLAGIVSCAISSQSQSWWNKIGGYYTPQVASIINQSSHPLLLSDGRLDGLLPISYLLEQKVKLQQVKDPDTLDVPEEFKDVFLFNCSKELQNELEKKYEIEQVHEPGELWQIKK